MDEIADRHTDTALDLQWNSAGEDAIEDALDCVIGTEKLFTLSSIWINEHEPAVAYRSSTMEVVDGSTVEGTLEFDYLESSGGDWFIRFKGITGDWDCGRTQVAAFGNDYFSLIRSMYHQCFNKECGGDTCVYDDTPGVASCECGTPKACSTVWGPGDGPSTDAMIKFETP